MSHFFTQARFWTSRWPNQTFPDHPNICYGSYDWWNWNMNILYLSDFDIPWDPYVTHFTNDSFFQKKCFKPYLRLAVTPANLSRSTQAWLLFIWLTKLADEHCLSKRFRPPIWLSHESFRIFKKKKKKNKWKRYFIFFFIIYKNDSQPN